MVRDREAATNAIVESSADKKLIVAGPGTGKTFTFREALQRSDGRGLALTFIRNLVRDLDAELGEIADVSTFHRFCKHQLHSHPLAAPGDGWHYYPSLPVLMEYDFAA